MFERMDYVVEWVDGDYAYLKREDKEEEDLKCVAMALLPEGILEGSEVVYEMMQYRME